MSKIILADYKDRLEGISPAANNSLESSFAEASRIMTPAGLKAYLEGACALYAMGKGEDLLTTYLEEMPLAVKEVGEDIIENTVLSVLKMTSQTSAAVLVLILISLPIVAKRMSDIHLLRDYLRLLEKMIALAPRGMRPMLSHIEELVGKLTLGGLRRWVMYGAETYRRDFKTQIDYFSLQSADARQILDRERRGFLFVDSSRKLQFYLRAFYNRDFFLRPTSGDYETRTGLKPYIEDGIVHIPDAYDDYQQVSGIDLYRATCSHAAAHLLHTKYAFDADELNPLQKTCIAFFEDMRVETITINKFPGLKSLWVSLHPQYDLSKFNPFIQDLVDLSLAILDGNHTAKATFNQQFVEKFHTIFATSNDDAQMSIDLGMAYYEDVCQATNVKISASALIDIPVVYRDDNRYLWEFSEANWDSDGSDYVPASQRTVRKDVNLMEMINNLDCELAGDDAQQIWTLNTEFFADNGNSLNAVEGKEYVSEPYHYHEWDYKMQIYRPNWVSLHERRLGRKDPQIIEDILIENKPIASNLKNSIERLQPQGLVRFKKQAEGSDLDLDACVDAITDIRMGITPSDRVYTKHRQYNRSVAVDLLMDLSESVNEVVAGDDKSILDLMQEAVTILAWSMQQIGDTFAISGFASDSRHDVQYYNIKPFQQSWDEMSKSRLAGIKGHLSTRMGSAIRHSSSKLLQQSTEKKLLLILTDGEPADIDTKDPQFLRLDAKKAIEEARSKGIITYGISLDPYADRYVARIFGSNRYTVIDRIDKLPEKLAQLFISLTK